MPRRYDGAPAEGGTCEELQNPRRALIGVCTLVGLAVTVATVFVPAAASATVCSAASAVKSFHGYVIVGFHHSVSGPDGGSGTMSVSLDRATGLVHFSKVAPLRTGAPVSIFRATSSGVMTVDDAYSDTSGTSGAQTDDGDAKVTVTIGFTNTPSGCAYTVVVGADTLARSTAASGLRSPSAG